MRRLRLFIPILAVASMCAGCSIGWRAGVGMSANTAGNVSGQVFVGGYMGARVYQGVEIAGSVRSKPLRGTFGADYRFDYRPLDDEDDDATGWSVGIYGGLRGVFGDGTVGEGRAGASVDVLPVVTHDASGAGHFGAESQLGVSSVFHPGRVLGEVTTRLFYDYATTLIRGGLGLF